MATVAALHYLTFKGRARDRRLGHESGRARTSPRALYQCLSALGAPLPAAAALTDVEMGNFAVRVGKAFPPHVATVRSITKNRLRSEADVASADARLAEFLAARAEPAAPRLFGCLPLRLRDSPSAAVLLAPDPDCDTRSPLEKAAAAAERASMAAAAELRAAEVAEQTKSSKLARATLQATAAREAAARAEAREAAAREEAAAAAAALSARRAAAEKAAADAAEAADAAWAEARKERFEARAEAAALGTVPGASSPIARRTRGSPSGAAATHHERAGRVSSRSKQ